MAVSVSDVLISAPAGRYSTGLLQATASKQNAFRIWRCNLDPATLM